MWFDFNSNSNVWPLLSKNISKSQFLGYSLANVVGLTVVLVGILFYGDSQNDCGNDEQFLTNDYVVLSKKVDGIGFSPVSFSEEEIDDLGKQKWVKKLGRFTASQFAVRGSVSLGGKGLSTYLFFESVPDDFFDVQPEHWDFSPEEKFVPVILNRDYLTLYNFGFAIPQGLPQVSEKVVGAIPVTLRLTGKSMETTELEAAVVGFSSRLNTIAVPQRFMDWANEHFSSNEYRQPSRLIVQVDALESSAMTAYLQAHDIEASGANNDTGNISRFLGVVSAVVTVNGLVIALLALFILVLSIYLLLLKNQTTLRNLMLLGYSPRFVAGHYEQIVIVINTLTVLIAVSVAFFARTFWSDALIEIGLGNASLCPMLLFAGLYLVGITALNIRTIRSHTTTIWNQG